jgi:hypothetical protein
MLFAEFPTLMRAMATRTCSRIRSRPANSGGGKPAPGEYGFSTGSTNITSLVNLCKLDKSSKFTIYPPNAEIKVPNIVHRDLYVVPGAQIALGRLDRGVAEEEFDLLQTRRSSYTVWRRYRLTQNVGYPVRANADDLD